MSKSHLFPRESGFFSRKRTALLPLTPRSPGPVLCSVLRSAFPQRSSVAVHVRAGLAGGDGEGRSPAASPRPVTSGSAASLCCALGGLEQTLMLSGLRAGDEAWGRGRPPSLPRKAPPSCPGSPYRATGPHLMLRYGVGRGYKPSSPSCLPRSPAREAGVPEASAFLGVLGMKQPPRPQVHGLEIAESGITRPAFPAAQLSWPHPPFFVTHIRSS